MDYWCKGLGQAQPKSEAWKKFKEMKKQKKEDAANEKALAKLENMELEL